MDCETRQHSHLLGGNAARWMAVLGHKILHCWQHAKERLPTGANPELEDTRKRTEPESGKLEWQTSADMAYSEDKFSFDNQ